ncbi:retrovirus-related pol polyprotein from transposon TNT 1-94 [Tanacetum coccineum]|uniref:Retrovirus-related pol polyprotein from transposon TNT 1-94 n=1 Tax=Tanacetum coccineum TaxID=301880 RepID=A0ABQ4ZB87_9ASTR
MPATSYLQSLTVNAAAVWRPMIGYPPMTWQTRGCHMAGQWVNGSQRRVNRWSTVVNDVQQRLTTAGPPVNDRVGLGQRSGRVATWHHLSGPRGILVPPPENQTVIVTKWVFKNKLDENGVVSRNKARLVAQGYNQQEGKDFDETYAPVARLESIRILLAYACAHDFKLFQMDVKSAFLNGFINEEVFIAQPHVFVDFKKPNHVFKLKKALYGLKQAPKAWYDRLKAFLLNHKYTMGLVDNTLFT